MADQHAAGGPANEHMAMYSLAGVTKSYNGRQVLSVADLDIRPGEILALVGPSGAGKSTLLRLLAFLEEPSTGTLCFRGQPRSDEWPGLGERRLVTMLFQQPQLLRRSVYDNIAYGITLRGNKDGREEVNAMIKRLGLQALAAASASTLSGGEAQRVALARSLVLQPQVLLLDEPTSNLDPGNVKLIEDMVRQVNQTDGMTVVVVTHNVFQARRLADRVGLLLEGELMEVGETEAFFERPKLAETAAFVRGDMVY